MSHFRVSDATFPMASENVLDADGGVEDVLQPLTDAPPADNQRGWPSWRDGIRRILSLSDNNNVEVLEQQISARLSGMRGGGCDAGGIPYFWVKAGCLRGWASGTDG